MLKEKLKMMNGVLENGNYQLGQFKFGELKKSLRKESKVVQTKKQYGDFSLTALSFASISIFSG